ncbi:MAG TPA: hypothetical protein VMI06_02945 [Terriglobia bacterium]|nr:hypothetical protein [Terriglobia bacterium]
MERSHGTRVQGWQLEGSVGSDGAAGGLVVHEALQQSINRYALPLRFLPDSRFSLWRDVEAHGNDYLLEITILSYATLAALSRLPCRLLGLSRISGLSIGNVARSDSYALKSRWALTSPPNGLGYP